MKPTSHILQLLFAFIAHLILWKFVCFAEHFLVCSKQTVRLWSKNCIENNILVEQIGRLGALFDLLKFTTSCETKIGTKNNQGQYIEKCQMSNWIFVFKSNYFLIKFNFGIISASP